MRRTPLFLLLLCGCATTTLPPPGAIDVSKFKFEVRDLRLPSGMRILVESDHSQPLVAFVGLVGSGSTADPQGKEGLAHLVEHLAFRTRPGTKLRTWGTFETLGVTEANAYTNYDETVYHELVPSEALAALLQFEGARLLRPFENVSADAFEAEREVVRNELRQRGETSPYQGIYSWATQTIFPEGHPYGRPVIGTHASISALTPADATAFIEAHYRAENMTLVISGDVDLSTIDATLKQTLPASLWQGSAPTVAPRVSGPAAPPPAPPAQFLTTREAAVASPELYLAWSLPRGYGDEAATLEMMKEIANRALPSAWAEDGDIAGVSAALDEGTEGSTFVIHVTLHEGSHPEGSADHVLNQVSRMWKGSPADAREELRNERLFARRHLVAIVDLALDSEDIMSRAITRARLTHFTGNPRAYTQLSGQRVAVKPTQVSDLAFRYLARERARALLVRPLPANATPAKESVGLEAGASGRDQTARVVFTADAVQNIARGPGLKDARRFTLGNGLQVVLVPRKTLPLVSVALGLPRGLAYGEPGAGALAQHGLVSVSTRHGEPSENGLAIRQSVDVDHTLVQVSGLSGNLSNALATLQDHVSSMKLNEGIVRVEGELLRTLEAYERMPESVAARRHRQALYSGSPWGRTDTVAEMKAAGPGQASKWINAAFRPDGATLVVAGDLDLDKTEAEVRSWFDGWSAAGSVESAESPLPSHAPIIQAISRPGATQGEVTLSCRVPADTVDARAGDQLLAHLVSHRLNHKLREELGGSYGVYGMFRRYRGNAGALRFETAVDNASLASALKQIRAQWAIPASASFDPPAFTSAQWNLLSDYRSRFRATPRLARAVAESAVSGEGPDDLDALPLAMAKLELKDLAAMWSVCQGSVVLTVVGDSAVVEGALAKSGFENPSR
jgi:zinc protease